MPIEEEDLDFVVERFRGLKGLIIDIRDNEGGDPLYGFRLARRIATERTHIYRQSIRAAPVAMILQHHRRLFWIPMAKQNLTYR